MFIFGQSAFSSSVFIKMLSPNYRIEISVDGAQVTAVLAMSLRSSTHNSLKNTALL